MQEGVQSTASYGDLFREGRASITVAIFSLIALFATDVWAVGTVLPTILRELGGVEFYGWVIGAYCLGNLITIPLLSVLAEKIGVRSCLMIGALFFFTGATTSALATEMEWIVLGRFVQGLGAGSFSSSTFRIISRFYPSDIQPRAVGVVSAIWGVAAVGGPLVGAGILSLLGWRWIFWYDLPVGGCILSLTFWALRKEESPAHPDTEVDFLGPPLFAVSTGLVLAGCYSELPLNVILVAGGIILYALFRIHEGRHNSPVIHPDVWKIGRPLGIAVMGTALLTISYGGAETFLPLLVQGVWQGSPLEAGFILTMGSIGWSLSSLIAPRFAQYPRILIIAGTLTVLCGLCALAAVTHFELSIYLLYPAWFVVGLGIGQAFPTLNTLVLDNERDYAAGVATGAFLLSSTWGFAIGPLVAGLVAQIGFDQGFDPRMVGHGALSSQAVTALEGGGVYAILTSVPIAIILLVFALKAPARRQVAQTVSERE